MLGRETWPPGCTRWFPGWYPDAVGRCANPVDGLVGRVEGPGLPTRPLDRKVALLTTELELVIGHGFELTPELFSKFEVLKPPIPTPAGEAPLELSVSAGCELDAPATMEADELDPESAIALESELESAETCKSIVPSPWAT
jgi:hypothetical protein